MRARHDLKQEDTDFTQLNCFKKGQLHQRCKRSDTQHYGSGLELGCFCWDAVAPVWVTAGFSAFG